MPATAVPNKVDLNALRERARIIRRHIVEMLHLAASGHPGGSLSAVEIVTALYFGGILRYDPANPEWEGRDRFILSKGHGVPVQYAALAEAGILPKAELGTLRRIDSRLQGHPVLGATPGIEASTGSLGQGLSIGVGMAWAARMDGRGINVYVLLGDGECQEGQVWEAAMSAGQHKLSNLVAIIDYNKFQLDGATRDILDLEPLAEKWRAFGWQVREIDGHDMAAVVEALEWARDAEGPASIVAHTIKGKGVSFMEGQNVYHGVAPSDEELPRALAELDVLKAAERSIDRNAAAKEEA